MRISRVLLCSLFGLALRAAEDSDDEVKVKKFAHEMTIKYKSGADPNRVLRVGLYSKMAPHSVANFLHILAGHLDEQKIFYKGTLFHHVEKGKYIEGGDISEGGTRYLNEGNGRFLLDGIWMSSVPLETQKMWKKHDRQGLISLARGPHRNGAKLCDPEEVAEEEEEDDTACEPRSSSKFRISLGPMPEWDAEDWTQGQQIIGEVLEGMDGLFALDEGVSKSGPPRKKTVILGGDLLKGEKKFMMKTMKVTKEQDFNEQRQKMRDELIKLRREDPRKYEDYIEQLSKSQAGRDFLDEEGEL